jgi:hypothetical protein
MVKRMRAPSHFVILFSIADMLIIPTLAVRRVLMAPLPVGLVAEILFAAVVLAFVPDVAKAATFSRLRML